MKPILGRVVAAAIAGGLLTAAAVPALAAPKTAGRSMTITATSKYGKVVGYLIVGYKSGAYSTTTVSGSITGLTAADKTDVVKLYAQPFPFTKPAVVVGTSAPLGISKKYHFSQAPTVRTHYQAKLFASAKATTPLATSAVQDVYVVSGGKVAGITKCKQPTCGETMTLTIYVPASALKAEMGKKTFPYFAVNTGATTAPAPTTLYLNGGKAKVSAPVKVAADQYKITISFTFNVGTQAYSWNWAACVPDAVTKDGLGVPGHHGCGAPSISVNTPYLG